jgi:hypothetical protein
MTMTARLLLLLTLTMTGLAVGGQAAPRWRTDLGKRSIALEELKPGGPGKDGIPALTRPKFETVAAAGKWLNGREAVIVASEGGETRLYPLQILLWHELVNDEVGGVPVLVSYCPLCNSAVVFDRRVDGKAQEFGVSGMLRDSDMVMFDRETESLWQQITGEAIVGDHTGKRLRMMPSQTVPFATAAEQYPGAKVLSRETGYERAYGRNPYVGYEFGDRLLFPVRKPALQGARMLERLVALHTEKAARAYPFPALRRRPVVEGELGGERYVVFYSDKAKSALDAEWLAASQDAGAVGVFRPVVDGRELRFQTRRDGVFLDEQTGSTWNLLGGATAGPLKGRRLEPFPHTVAFAFAWMVFRPDTEIVRPGKKGR